MILNRRFLNSMYVQKESSMIEIDLLFQGDKFNDIPGQMFFLIK